MKKWVLFVFIFAFLLIPFISGYSTSGDICTCNSCGDCTAAVEDLTCGVVRLANDLPSSAGNPSCITSDSFYFPAGRNLVLDCQNRNVFGSSKSISDGIYLLTYNSGIRINVTNCNIENYANGVRLVNYGSNNIFQVYSNKVTNATSFGINLINYGAGTVGNINKNNILNRANNGISTAAFAVSTFNVSNNFVSNSSSLGIVMSYGADSTFYVADNIVNYSGNVGIYIGGDNVLQKNLLLNKNYVCSYSSNDDFYVYGFVSPSVINYNLNTCDSSLVSGICASSCGLVSQSPPSGCTNECTSGTKQCSGNGVQTCGNHDADSCTEWGSVTSCLSDQTCSGGVCSDNTCTGSSTSLTYANSVISYSSGLYPPLCISSYQDSNQVIGSPNYVFGSLSDFQCATGNMTHDGNSILKPIDGTYSLGYKGNIVLGFTKLLTNSGSSRNDLCVFETGSQLEVVDVYARPVGNTLNLLSGNPNLIYDPSDPTFIFIGRTETGGTGGIDVDNLFSSYSKGLLRFDRIKLIDAARQYKNSTGTYVDVGTPQEQSAADPQNRSPTLFQNFAGADIDAVGIIESEVDPSGSQIDRVYFEEWTEAGVRSEVLSGIREIGQWIYIVAETQNLPDGTELRFEIYEDDSDGGIGVTDDIIRNGNESLIAIVSNNRAVVSWIVTEQDFARGNDGASDSELVEFYAIAKVQSLALKSNNLDITNLPAIGGSYVPLGCEVYPSIEECNVGVVPDDELSSLCTGNNTCECSWNDAQNRCQNIVSGANGGSCAYVKSSETGCGSDGINYVSYTAVVQGNFPSAECVDKEVANLCALAIVLPFFGVLQLIIVIIIISLAYVFLKRFRYIK